MHHIHHRIDKDVSLCKAQAGRKCKIKRDMHEDLGVLHVGKVFTHVQAWVFAER